ncbi:MAG: mechanosensitive ion channel family protein [Bacteroides sp.]|nr:mechanosensitive ion channel family protein [Roseburia sp.]MCM1347199.1 mechanosensitive ion channel family protein [Bacteroides sp.]MCM1421651.1 mechanosensitive ion channel family protein [Bacteroides sp.]
MHILEKLDNWNELSDYQFLGISLKDPIIFCIKTVVILVFIKAILWFANFMYKRWQSRKAKRALDETSGKFLMRVVTTIVYILGVASILSLIPALEKIGTSILASAGILAMAVGLASQEALSNFVGGIFIIIGKPFRIGDYIELDSKIIGTVTEITLRHTVIRCSDNRLVIVPNSKINSSAIFNSTLGDTATCAFIEVGVAYTENLDRCIAVMRDEIEKHPLLIDRRTQSEIDAGTPKVLIRVIALGDSAITLRAYAWAGTPSQSFTLKCDSFKAIKERFDNENIEIPYPYYNQIIKQG